MSQPLVCPFCGVAHLFCSFPAQVGIRGGFKLQGTAPEISFVENLGSHFRDGP